MSLLHGVRPGAMMVLSLAALSACAGAGGDGGPGVTSGSGGEAGGSSGGSTGEAGASSGGAGGDAAGGQSGQGGQIPTSADGGAAGPGGRGGVTGSGGTGGQVVVPPPAGKVPMFIAAGHGGRTITSCDDGRTWIANHAYENQNVDHSPYTEKGFVYGNGLFMLLIGWGAPATVKVSGNGVDWQRFDVPDGGGGGLAYLDKPSPKFVSINGWGGCQSSANGQTWSKCKAPDYPENLREAGGGGESMGGGGDIAATFTFDAGATWKTASACALTDGFGNLGQLGGFAWGNNAFVAVGSSGDWCQTTNKGSSWKTGKLATGIQGKVAFLGDRFWAPNGGSGYWSTDGAQWTPAAFTPGGTVIHAMARSDLGTYVGIQRQTSSTRYYRSTDGVNWTLTMGTGGTELRRVIFGYGSPSAACPLQAN